MPRLTLIFAVLVSVVLTLEGFELFAETGPSKEALPSETLKLAVPLAAYLPESDIQHPSVAIDDRVRVAPTTAFPARAIVHITGKRLDDGWSKCTGTFIGPRLVLTAAHCLWDVGFGADAGIIIIPGADGDAKPFGEATMQRWWVPSEWREGVVENSYAQGYDFGLILLAEELGLQTGWLSVGQLSYASLAAPDLNPVIQGYPGDKPEKTQWRSTRTEITYNSGLGMYIGMDTFVYHGESGSALRRQSDNLILGVLTLGYHSAEDHVAYALTANYTMLRQLEKGCDYLGCSIPYYIEPRAKAASTTGPTPSPTVSPVLPKPSSTPIALPANAAPALLSPSTGSEFLGGFTGTLEWSLQKGATQVQLQVLPARNDGAGIDTILSGVTSFVVPAPPDWYGLLPGMSYSWRVRASAKPTSASPDDSSWGPWSETRTFWTPPPEVVLVPVQPAPNGRVRGSEVQLQWTLWNASIGKELFYWEVQLSSDSTFNTDPATATTSVYQNLVHGAVSETPNSWKAPILMPGTYFWRVRPRVQGDGVPADWSALWSFTVVP